MYACGFRFYFTPLPGFFSPFPHGTCSLSVEDPYLALENGPPIFRQGFSCPALLFVILVPTLNFHLRAYHPLRIAFPYNSVGSVCIYNRLLPVRSPLLRESRLISFPRVTEMFQFARFAFQTYVFSLKYPKGWVSPFGDRGINALLPTPPRFSQAYTSFIASLRQGIHHKHLVA